MDSVTPGENASISALKITTDGNAEVKSARTHPDFLRIGADAAILETIIAATKRYGVQRLSLETGSRPAFELALKLYWLRRFVKAAAFGSYIPSELNQFFHLELREGHQGCHHKYSTVTALPI